MTTKEKILADLQVLIDAYKKDLDKVEPAVSRALESAPEYRDSMIDRALTVADINEGGDLRMWLVNVLREGWT